MPVPRLSCRYPGQRKSVHIKLFVSPVSFSHNNVRLLMVYRPFAVWPFLHGLDTMNSIGKYCEQFSCAFTAVGFPLHIHDYMLIHTGMKCPWVNM